MEPTPVEQLLAPLRPDEHALQPFFQANIDDSMLREMADVDCGHHFDKRYALLQPIPAAERAPRYDYDLNEVLQLALADAGNPREHWMRLFASATLVRMAPTHRHGLWSEDHVFAALTASAICLSPDVARAAPKLLAWRFLIFPGDDPAFLSFAILLLAVFIERDANRGAWLKQLAEWVMQEEAQSRHETWTSEWLLGARPFEPMKWVRLAQKILLYPEQPHLKQADADLRLIGAMVVGE